MTVTVDWDETKPADARNPALGDDDIREFKKNFRERVRKGGHYNQDGSSGPATADTDEGKHVCGEEQLGDGAANDGLFKIFESNGHAGNRTTAAVAIGDGAASTADTVTIGDGVDGSRPYTLAVDLLSGKRIHDVAVPLPASATGRVNGVYFYNKTGHVLTIESIDAYANTAPTGANLTIDVHLHASGWTDLSSGGTSIVASPPTISIVAGSRRAAAPVTAFSDATVADGEVLAFEIDQGGSTIFGADIILFIKFRRIG